MNTLHPTALLLALAALLSPASGQSLAEALDTPDLAWETGGDLFWQPLSSTTAIHGSALARLGPFALSPGVPGPEVAGWLQTTVTGPGIFRTYIKSTRTPDITAALSLHGGDEGVLDPTGTDATSSSVINWSPLSITIPPGTHDVRLQGSFRYRAGGYYYTQPILEADAAKFYPSLPVTGEALDAPDLTWLTAGEPGFLPVTGDTHDGSDALHAPGQGSPARLETHLTGPVTVSWWRRGTASLQLSGNAAGIAPGADWIRDTFFLGAGKQWIRWDTQNSQTISLDEFRAVPATSTSLASALNAPDLAFSTNQWQAHQTAAASDGEAHAWVVPDKETPAWLETSLAGPALIHFTAGSLGGNLRLQVKVDGSPVLLVFPEGLSSSVLIPQGYHTVRWETEPDPYWPAPPLFTLDQIKVSPLPATSVTQALDATNLTWRFLGFSPWSSAAAAEAHDTSDFAYSPAVFSGQSSRLETTVTGPGTLSFWWTSKAASADATFTIPGTPLSLPVPRSWNQETIEIPAGDHALHWHITGSAGTGAILLDQVTWEPASHPPASDALDLPPTLLLMPGASAFRDTSTKDDGEASLRLEAGPGTYSASFTLWIQGPARVEGRILTPTGFFSPAPLINSPDWRPFVLEIQPGLHPLTFTHDRGSIPLDQPSSSWMDAVRITSMAIPLGEGLSAPDFEWRTNPDNPWSGMNSPASNAPAMIAAPGPFGALHPPSWLETTVTGPAVASFTLLGRYRISLDGTPNFYGSSSAFYPDGAAIWIPPGVHTLRWQQDEAASGWPPFLSGFRHAPMAGVPSLVRSQNHFLLTVPRPAGFTDSRITIQQADYRQSSFFLDLSPQPPIISSTPEAVTYRLTPPPNAGSSLFWRASLR